MPNQPLTPQQKKELSYGRDHYVRAGESMRGWRRIKRVKKRQAVHVARHKAKRAISEVEMVDTPGKVAARQLWTIKQSKIQQEGVLNLGQYAKRASKRRKQS